MTKKRPLCSCRNRPVAVNYKREGVTYYRSKCDKCLRLQKKLSITPIANWQKTGYKKKKNCEKCGFKAQHTIQLIVYHTDGDRNNNKIENLKTVCLNCAKLISIEGLGWAQGDLVPDF